MKKLITMAVAILITACIAAFASGNKPTLTPRQKFDYQMSFSRIVVDDDIDLQVKEGDDKNIDLAGAEADVNKVDWKIKDDVLYINSKKGSLKDKVQVTVSVSHLKEIFIKGESVVSSAGVLLSPDLHVYMNESCYVALKNTGKIFIINSSNTEVIIKKLEGDVQIGR